MLVFWKPRLVFLATPKTASTAFERVLAPLAAMTILRPPALKHTNVQRFRRFVAPFLAEADGGRFETVAIMREPRDWLGSWYRYRQRPDEVPEKSTKAISFDRFVVAYCQTERPEFAKIGSQAHFLAPKNHKPADHIFRYDRLHQAQGFLQDRLGVAFHLPIENVSPAGDLALSDSSLAHLQHKCRRDFDLYASLP